MESVETKTSNWVELRVLYSSATVLDAWMTVNNEGHAMHFPVRTQLGMPITVSVDDGTLAIRDGKLFIHDGGRSSPAVGATKKPTYGLIRYLDGTKVEAAAHEQFHVKLYVPTERYNVIWDLGARGHLPRLISLQVKGLQDDAQWDVAESGPMLLIEDFSFSFPISPPGLLDPT
jgi:hypothetical protein